jgi:hypothetical protein
MPTLDDDDDDDNDDGTSLKQIKRIVKLTVSGTYSHTGSDQQANQNLQNAILFLKNQVNNAAVDLNASPPINSPYLQDSSDEYEYGEVSDDLTNQSLEYISGPTIVSETPSGSGSIRTITIVFEVYYNINWE